MFTTKRLVVTHFSEADAEDFFPMSNEEGFNLFPITIYRQKSLDSTREWLRTQKGKYAVRTLADKKLIGMGGLTPWTWEGEELFDITYRLRESGWGKGFGMELAEGLVRYGFSQLHLREITATITPDNVASKKIAEKLGMNFDQHIILKGVPTDLFRLKAT